MSLHNIKKFEWFINSDMAIKIESINSYLNTQTLECEYHLINGYVHVICTDTSDMQWDDDKNELILLDNTDYWFIYNDKFVDIRLMDDLLKKSIEGKGILNSHNYVGKVDIGIEECSVVVKSRKVNYDRDFAFLRASIAEFCTALLSRSSSYYTGDFSKSDVLHGDRINYSEIAYLKDILSPEKLPTWIDYFIYHAEHVYEKSVGIRALSEAEEIEVDFYINGLLSGNLFKSDKVVGNAGRYYKVPMEIEYYEYNMTYDTNENRFIKFFVLYLRDYLWEIYTNVDKTNIKLRREIEKMLEIIEERMENPLWNKISKMERIPFDSQILQKKYPYNLMFQVYTEFELVSRINLGEIDKKYSVGQKDAPMLYQYWVFVMLFKHLAQKYEEKYVTSDWIVYDGKNLAFSLKEGRKSMAIFSIDDETEIFLLYNKTYDSKHSIWEGRSYSHELKPDISIELYKKNKLVAIIHFDAKYKAPVNGTDMPDDINKMHAYKDGIMGTVGAYAICLADEKILYREEEKGWENEEMFPSVGAYPLNLNTERSEQELEDIMHIVDAFVRLDIKGDANKFSEKHLVKYYSLIRKMMKIEE